MTGRYSTQTTSYFIDPDRKGYPTARKVENVVNGSETILIIEEKGHRKLVNRSSSIKLSKLDKWDARSRNSALTKPLMVL